MKKILLATSLFSSLFWISTFAQTNVFPTSGNVGIGTTSPTATLFVRGDVVFRRGDTGGSGFMRFHSDASGNYLTSDDPGTNHKNLYIRAMPTGPNSTDRSIIFQTGKSNDTPQSRMIVTGSGNVGIGTTNPSHRIHVAGSGKWTGNSSSFTEIHSNTSGQYLRQFANNGTTESWIIRGYATSGVQAMFNSGGINVNGTIKAKEVNITATGWSDYVFLPEYRLMPLGEVENFIRENGHLPNIPNETEVLKNGINLGEINAKLLEKVEELTLYLIEQKSELESQRLLITEQSKKIGLLLKQMEHYSIRE